MQDFRLGRLVAPLGLALLAGCGSGEAQQVDRIEKERGAPMLPPPGPTDGAGGALFEGGAVSARGHFTVGALWTDGPKIDKDNRVTLIFGDEARAKPNAVEGVTLVPWMPEHDHGVPRDSMKNLTLTAKPEALNEIDVTLLHFIMKGDWELRIEATVDGVTDSAVLPVSVP